VIKNLINIIEAGSFILLSLLIALLPHRLALKTGEILGLLVFYAWGSRRKIAIENIENSEVTEHSSRNSRSVLSARQKSEARIVAKETFKNLGKSFVEVIKIYYGFGKGIIDNIEIRGVENYHSAKSKNKGVIFITGHCGNWELMALTFGFRIGNVSSVAREQNNPYLNRLVEKTRVKYGNKIIYKKGALKSMLSELKNNKMVGILMDQAAAKDDGVVIDFLGRPAWTTKMPAVIARKTGAPVLPIFINRTRVSHIINIYPEVNLSTDATNISLRLTKGDENVIPAEAGIQKAKELDSRLHGNDKLDVFSYQDIDSDSPKSHKTFENKDKAIIEDTKRFSEFIENYIKEHPTEWLWIHKRWKRT
jgi:KDO2-lipid IV(A) lauroyltransferase